MTLSVPAARAGAVFVSTLQESDKPGGQQIHFTVANMARTHGCRRVAGLVAQEFGDHPDTALQRMTWARDLVAESYPKRRQR